MNIAPLAAWSRYLILFAVLLLSSLGQASSASLSLDQFSWPSCPQAELSGLSLSSEGKPSIKLASLKLDSTCLAKAQPASSKSASINLMPLKQALFELSQQLQTLKLPAQAKLEITQVNWLHHPLAFEAKDLELSKQADNWQLVGRLRSHRAGKAKQESEQEWAKLAMSFSLGDGQGHSEGKLAIPRSLFAYLDESLLSSLEQAGFSLAEGLQLQWSGAVLPQLQLTAELQQPQQLSLQLEGWQQPQLQVQAAPQTWLGQSLPGFAFTAGLTEQKWTALIDDWQFQAQGEWSLAPQFQVHGRALLASLSSIQQHFSLLPQLQLLSGEVLADFSWSSDYLTMDYQGSGFVGVWDEYLVQDAGFAGSITGNSVEHIQHQGSAQVAQLDLGIALQQLALHWQSQQSAALTDWQALQLTQVSFDTLGGHFELDPLALKPPSESHLRFRGVELGLLADLYPELALVMRGKLNGDLPIHWREQGLAISQGELSIDDQGGHIALGHEAVMALKQQHPMLEYALGLLEDFDYETLAAEVDFTEDGQLDMRVSLAGFNPEITPRKVILNYHHQENIYQLLRSLRIGDQLSGQVQQWIDAASP